MTRPHNVQRHRARVRELMSDPRERERIHADWNAGRKQNSESDGPGSVGAGRAHAAGSVVGPGDSRGTV